MKDMALIVAVALCEVLIPLALIAALYASVAAVFWVVG